VLILKLYTVCVSHWCGLASGLVTPVTFLFHQADRRNTHQLQLSDFEKVFELSMNWCGEITSDNEMGGRLGGRAVFIGHLAEKKGKGKLDLLISNTQCWANWLPCAYPPGPPPDIPLADWRTRDLRFPGSSAAARQQGSTTYKSKNYSGAEAAPLLLFWCDFSFL
jgi:hypothetical protein